MLAVQNISFCYADNPLLEQVNFSLHPGQMLQLSGSNGSGKTTLLKLLAGFLQPQEGDIHYQGQPIFKNLPDYHDQLCFIGHKGGVSPQLSVKENLLLDLHWRNSEITVEQVLVESALETLTEVRCFRLSLGQQRRVALARLVFSKARLWLLDEPLTALDQPTIRKLGTQFEAHLNQGGQIILTSHQPLPLQRDYLEYRL